MYTSGAAMPRKPPLRPLTAASVVCSVIVLPSRTTVMVTRDPGLARLIALWSWVQLLTGVPSKAITLSPGRSPASLAGDGGFDAVQTPLSSAGTFDPTQGVIVPSWAALLGFWMPM